MIVKKTTVLFSFLSATCHCDGASDPFYFEMARSSIADSLECRRQTETLLVVRKNSDRILKGIEEYYNFLNQEPSNAVKKALAYFCLALYKILGGSTLDSEKEPVDLIIQAAEAGNDKAQQMVKIVKKDEAISPQDLKEKMQEEIDQIAEEEIELMLLNDSVYIASTAQALVGRVSKIASELSNNELINLIKNDVRFLRKANYSLDDIKRILFPLSIGSTTQKLYEEVILGTD